MAGRVRQACGGGVLWAGEVASGAKTFQVSETWKVSSPNLNPWGQQ